MFHSSSFNIFECSKNLKNWLQVNTFSYKKLKMTIIYLLLKTHGFFFFLLGHTSTFHRFHNQRYKPNHKRVEIPRPDTNDQQYVTGNFHRRQEVIHPLDSIVNGGSMKNDNLEEDIEELGKTLDANGKEVKTNRSIIKNFVKESNNKSTSKEIAQNSTTRDIISKIKELQDKIFKRTGSKELESKLNQMSPVNFPFPLTTENISNPKPLARKFDNKNANNNSKSSKKSKDETEREKIKNELQQKDGSLQPDRRKIIPEEVVDKILEKFQQLRQEAKHMALLESQNIDKENAGEFEKQICFISYYRENIHD